MTKMPFEDAGAGLVRNWVRVNIATGDHVMPRIGVAIRTTGTGDVTFTDIDGATETMTLNNFETIPASVAKILKTGTTASGVFVGLP